jgi:hypothetical protein
MKIKDSLSDFVHIFFFGGGGVGGRYGHGVIEPFTPFFFFPSSYHSLCSLPPQFGSKAKSFRKFEWVAKNKKIVVQIFL